jgi:hypothetical protein
MWSVATIITYRQYVRQLPSLGEEYRDFDKKVNELNISTMLVLITFITSMMCHSRSVSTTNFGN